MADGRVLIPRDPEAFKAEVLRRAMRIERRRRRARVLAGVPVIVALALAGVLLAQRDGESDTTGVAAAASTPELTAEVVDIGTALDPWSVVVDTDGEVWVLARGDAETTLVDLGAEDAVDLPDGSRPEHVVAGTDEALWATDPAGRRVLRVGDDGTVTTWPTDSPPSATATWLAGRLWFAEPDLDRITGIGPDGGVVHHGVPEGRRPDVVAAGPDGAVWYASRTSARIGSVSPSGAVSEHDLDGDDARAVTLTAGPGPSLWMVVVDGDRTTLARVDPSGRVAGEDVAVVRPPTAMSIGPDGRLWFSSGEATVNVRSVARLTVRPLGRTLDADAWALGADDAMWAVDRARRQVLRITAG